MPNWIPDIIKVLFPALIIAVLTSILTVSLALRRFYKEKWWEKKHETYSHLLETLHHLKNYAAEHFEGEIDPNYITEEKSQELAKDWKKFSREFAKLSDLASFHLSKESVEILNKYQKEKAEVRKSKTIFEIIDGDLAAASNCLEALKEAAKRDLKIK